MGCVGGGVMCACLGDVSSFVLGGVFGDVFPNQLFGRVGVPMLEQAGMHMFLAPAALPTCPRVRRAGATARPWRGRGRRRSAPCPRLGTRVGMPRAAPQQLPACLALRAPRSLAGLLPPPPDQPLPCPARVPLQSSGTTTRGPAGWCRTATCGLQPPSRPPLQRCTAAMCSGGSCAEPGARSRDLLGGVSCPGATPAPPCAEGTIHLYQHTCTPACLQPCAT